MPSGSPSSLHQNGSVGKLRFKSGFEEPVEIAYTSPDGDQQRLGYGDIEGSNWSDISHAINYVDGE